MKPSWMELGNITRAGFGIEKDASGRISFKIVGDIWLGEEEEVYSGGE